MGGEHSAQEIVRRVFALRDLERTLRARRGATRDEPSGRPRVWGHPMSSWNEKPRRARQLAAVMLSLDGFTHRQVGAFLGVSAQAVWFAKHRTDAPLRVGVVLRELVRMREPDA